MMNPYLLGVISPPGTRENLREQLFLVSEIDKLFNLKQKESTFIY